MPKKYKKSEKSVSAIKSPEVYFARLQKWLINRERLLLNITAVLLVIVIAGALGIRGYKSSLIKEKEGLIQKAEELNNQRDLAAEARFVKLKGNIENMQEILQNHIYSSKFFEMLEELTLPRVVFNELNADFLQAKVNLDTEAADYQTLVKQMVVFEQDERVKKVKLSEVGLETTGRIGSDLELELEPFFLRSPN